MDFLNKIITLMNKQEIRFYKLYASRVGQRQEGRKDIRLFEYIRKNGDLYKEAQIYAELYKNADKNSFYRLKNHLFEEINKCTLLHYINNDDAVLIHSLAGLARIYLNKNNYEITHYFLKKAEKKAIELEQYELLDSIYAEFVKLSHHFNLINPEIYIERRNRNLQNIDHLRRMDNALAVLNFRLQRTQNFSRGNPEITKEVNKIIKDFSAGADALKSPRFRFRAYEIVSQALLQQRDYKSLEKCVLKTYSEFLKDNLFNRGNHHEKIQMLIFLCNSYFKNKKYEDSLNTAKKLLESLKEYRKRHYDKYIFFYYNTLAINYSETDKDKAIEVLNLMIEHETIGKDPYYRLFILLSLAALWFEKLDYKKAIKSLIQMKLLGSFKKMDMHFRLKAAIAELIIRLELDQNDLVERQIISVKKEFRELLNTQQYESEKEFLSILIRINRSPIISNNRTLLKKIYALGNMKGKESDDEQIIDYQKWLMKKCTPGYS